MVPAEGLEPSWVAPADFESAASTSSATLAFRKVIISKIIKKIKEKYFYADFIYK